MKLIDLRQKEVINMCDCHVLGCPIDLEFHPHTGVITALILPGPVKFCGLLGREHPLLIPWECICQIGDEIILVNLPKKPPEKV